VYLLLVDESIIGRVVAYCAP